MATLELHFSAHTKLARVVLHILKPAVFVGIISVERAANIACRFIRVMIK